METPTLTAAQIWESECNGIDGPGDSSSHCDTSLVEQNSWQNVMEPSLETLTLAADDDDDHHHHHHHDEEERRLSKG